MDAVLCCHLAIWKVVGWRSSLGIASVEKGWLIQSHAPFLEQLKTSNWSRDIKAQVPIPTLKAISASVFPRRSVETLWLSCNLISPPVQFCFLFFTLYRCQSQEYSQMNLPHTNPHLRVCFQGNSPCSASLKESYLPTSLPTGWNTRRLVVSELWPYGWREWLNREKEQCDRKYLGHWMTS